MGRHTRRAAVVAVALLALGACDATGGSDGTGPPEPDAPWTTPEGPSGESSSGGSPSGESSSGGAEAPSADTGTGATTDAAQGTPVGRRVFSWIQQAEEAGPSARDHEGVLTSQEALDAWYAALAAEVEVEGLDPLEVDIDFDDSVAVAVAHYRCGNHLLLVTDGAGGVAGQQVPDEPGVHVDCYWSPAVVELYEVTLVELGAAGAAEVVLDRDIAVSDHLWVPTG